MQPTHAEFQAAVARKYKDLKPVVPEEWWAEGHVGTKPATEYFDPKGRWVKGDPNSGPEPATAYPDGKLEWWRKGQGGKKPAAAFPKK